jgi:hypothetical protein
MDNFCIDCFYLTKEESKEFPLSDYHTKYGCKLHQLFNGELSDPHWQKCEDFLSVKSGLRNIKIEQIINS